MSQTFAHSRQRFSIAAVQDDQEFIVSPPADNVCSPNLTSQRMCNDAQQRRGCFRSESGPESLQTLHSKKKDTDSNLAVGESCQCVAQVLVHLYAAGQTRDIVEAPRENFFP